MPRIPHACLAGSVSDFSRPWCDFVWMKNQASLDSCTKYVMHARTCHPLSARAGTRPGSGAPCFPPPWRRGLVDTFPAPCRFSRQAKPQASYLERCLIFVCARGASQHGFPADVCGLSKPPPGRRGRPLERSPLGSDGPTTVAPALPQPLAWGAAPVWVVVDVWIHDVTHTFTHKHAL